MAHNKSQVTLRRSSEDLLLQIENHLMRKDDQVMEDLARVTVGMDVLGRKLLIML